MHSISISRGKEPQGAGPARACVTAARRPVWPVCAQPTGPLPPPGTGRSHLLGRLPEHVAHAAAAAQPVAQHRDDAHEQRLTRALLVLLRLSGREQLWGHKWREGNEKTKQSIKASHTSSEKLKSSGAILLPANSAPVSNGVRTALPTLKSKTCPVLSGFTLLSQP